MYVYVCVLYIYSLCICDVYACILPSPRVLSRIPSLSLSLSPLFLLRLVTSRDRFTIRRRMRFTLIPAWIFQTCSREKIGRIQEFLHISATTSVANRAKRVGNRNQRREGVHARVCKRGKVLLSRAVLNGSTRQKVCRWRPAVDGPWHFSFFFFSLQEIQAILFFWELRFFHIHRLSSLLFFIARFWRRIENIRKKINLILRLKRSSSGNLRLDQIFTGCTLLAFLVESDQVPQNESRVNRVKNEPSQV